MPEPAALPVPKEGGPAPEGAGIRFRPAIPADRDQIARLHHACSRLQPGGFMHRLGLSFFRSYYRILLPDPNTVVISAEDPSGRILGFVAGCRDARAEMERLQRHRARLFLACLLHLLRSPALLLDLRARMRYLDADGPDSWGDHHGARISFWCWDPASTAARQSTLLLQRYLGHMRDTGAPAVRLEVDRINRKVEMTHRMMGAITVRSVRTPGGQERLVMEHRFAVDQSTR